jgi:hypothetical protein
MRNQLMVTELNFIHPSRVRAKATGIPEVLRCLLRANMSRHSIGEA